MKHPNQSGFTLVELAIVLVILGLLTAGVLVGQDMIRSAQMQSITAGLSRYETAVKQFQKQYVALPGDFAEATDVWGAASGGTKDACATASVATAQNTCNGDGDGLIDSSAGFTANWVNTERYLAWKHMANAGIIDGSFTGKTASGSNNDLIAPGTNIPRAEFDALGYSIRTNEAAGSDANWFAGSFAYTTVLVLQSIGNTAILTPLEAYGIDGKLDDGNPGLGRVQTHRNGATTLGTCATSATAYALTLKSPACTLLYGLGLQ
jgi:prepilin-type N-terminal cleavage/methylation domain-containing protein